MRRFGATYKSDSPFSYEVEEGELSCESGRSSPGTIRDCASDCGTQTDNNMITNDENIKTLRVELENETQIVQTPQEIARKIQNRFGHRRNLQSFDTGNNNINNISEQGTNIATHSYQNTRPRQNYNYNSSDTYMSPPLPNYPPPVRPPPPVCIDFIYKFDRYTKQTLGFATFYNPHTGLSYTCRFN